MTVTGTPISLLPTGTIDNLSAVIPMSVGMLGVPSTIRTPLTQVSTALKSVYDGAYLPSGTYFQPTGTINTSVLTGTYNIQFFLGNGSSVVPTGSVIGGYHYVEVPYASQIESWSLLGDVTGSITINVLKSTYAGFPPTSPLAGLGQPKLTSQRKNNGTPTGTVSLAAQDVLLVEVVSASTVKIADLSLRARKL